MPLWLFLPKYYNFKYVITTSIKITNKYASFNMDVGKKSERKATSSETQKRIKAHYAHAQLAWFTFIGGKSYQSFLKQRMFLTIYGIISKKGYKIFDYNKNITTVKSAITASLKGMPKASFDSAPHLLLSWNWHTDDPTVSWCAMLELF